MKEFLKKTVVFAIAPVVVLFSLILILVNQKESNAEKFKVDSSIVSIYVGDSHIQQAINDSLLKQSKNLGVDSESFYFTYYKLKHYLEANKEVENVYLGVSYHSLSSYFDEYITGEYSRTVSLRYFYDLPPSERLTCIKWNSNNVSSYLKELITMATSSEDTKSVTVGYRNTFTASKAKKSSMDKRIKFQFYTEGQLNDFSTINIDYLDKIVSMCREKNIEITLLNTPMHPYYQDKIPAEYLEHYEQIVAKKKLKVIDFSSVKLDDSCFIPDGDHVSVKGAKLITDFLRTTESH